MADDRDLIIGELREGVRSIKEHLRRQDDVAMARDQQLEINKREAIKAREEKEARDEQRFRVLDEKTTNTGGRVSLLEKTMDEEVRPVVGWFHDEGSKLGGRVSTLEQAEVKRTTAAAHEATMKAGREGEKRGSMKAWALVWSGAVAIGGALAAYGREILDFLRGLNHG